MSCVSNEIMALEMISVPNCEVLADRQPLPTLVEARHGVTLDTWLSSNMDEVRQLLRGTGAILFRGFEVSSASAFATACETFAKPLLPYVERTAPRVEVLPCVYTSTEHPSAEKIQLHNANSYSHTWPRWIWFYCEHEPETGGHTSIASAVAVNERLDPDIRTAFRDLGVQYMRNFRKGMGLSWQECFGTELMSEVQAYCNEADINIDHFEGDTLRLYQTRPAYRVHPDNLAEVWFNQAHLFHSSSLRPELRSMLLRSYGELGMPRHASFGDGSSIDDYVADHLRECFDRETVLFDWHKGDVLLLDNMLALHGRTPFTGSRRILVCFAEAYSEDLPQLGSNRKRIQS